MKILLLSAIATMAIFLCNATAKNIPTTGMSPVTDYYHGKTMKDPYRWLEGNDAPEITNQNPELDKKVADWTKQQNNHTREILDNLPNRKKLESRLSELMKIDSISAPVTRGNLYFYTARKGAQSQPVLYVREGYKGKSRVLLDVNKMDKDGLLALSWFEPSQSGKYVAYGTYRSGDENSTLYLLQTNDGKTLDLAIPGKVSGVNWLPNDAGFIYRKLADLDNPYSGQIMFHMMNTKPEKDQLIFEQYKEGPLATTWGPFAYLDRKSNWLALGYYTGTESNDLWVYDFQHWLKTRELKKIDISIGEKATHYGPIIGNSLFLITTLNASNGKIVKIDLTKPDQSNWQEIIPEQKDAVIESVDVADNKLAISYLIKAHNKIKTFDLSGKPLKEVKLPGLGSAGINTNETSNEVFLSYESFNQPDSIYHLDLTDPSKLELWEKPDVPVNPDNIAVKQVTYPSKDGTKVTMFIVHKKDLKLDGKRPTILYGYGGFNISITPSFNATRFPWFESGGVYAITNLRGGGEYGKSWHKAGMLEQKQNVFDDFIAAANYLIDNKYTSSKQLGIYGGSNGGLLTGAAVTQQPELFGAVISAVPLLDMLRYQHFLMAKYWVPEYGSSENKDQYDYLAKYSPYHNIKKTNYPAIFITAGENDTRVHPMHARKMAAKLQAITTSDQTKDPILLWVEQEAGHGRGKPLNIRIRDAADVYGFFGWQLGANFNKL